MQKGVEVASGGGSLHLTQHPFLGRVELKLVIAQR